MYRSNNNWQSDIKQRFQASYSPATVVIIGLAVVCWFILALTNGEMLSRLVGFHSSLWPIPCPWTVVTWPILLGGNPLFALLAVLWFYNVGSSVERSWGTQRFIAFFLATNVMTAVTLYLGGLITHQPISLSGLWIGDASTTIAWCLLNRRETVCLGMVIPIPAIWLAYLTVAMVWYSCGAVDGVPLLGLFALSGCGFAWWYTTKGRSSGFGGNGYTFRKPNLSPPRRPESDGSGGFSLSKMRKEREEQKRLEDMFRRSGYDDKDNR